MTHLKLYLLGALRIELDDQPVHMDRQNRWRRRYDSQPPINCSYSIRTARLPRWMQSSAGFQQQIGSLTTAAKSVSDTAAASELHQLIERLQNQ